MNKSPKPKARIATRAEVDAALAKLDEAEEKRIDRFAAMRARAVSMFSATSGEDLVHEAFMQILIGAEDPQVGRHWPIDSVDFVKFVLEVIRSLSSHAIERARETQIVREADTQLTDENDGATALTYVANPSVGAERQVIGELELARVLKLFDDDDHELLIIEGWREGMNAGEIQTALGMTKSEYSAALKRIRYKTRNER